MSTKHDKRVVVERCGVTRKIRFSSLRAAEDRAREIEKGEGVKLRAYNGCVFCGGAHLTSQPRG